MVAPHPLERHAASKQEQTASNAASAQKIAAIKASRPQRAPAASVAELAEQQASPATSITYVGLGQGRPRPESSHAAEPKKPSDVTADPLEGTMRCGLLGRCRGQVRAELLEQLQRRRLKLLQQPAFLQSNYTCRCVCGRAFQCDGFVV